MVTKIPILPALLREGRGGREGRRGEKRGEEGKKRRERYKGRGKKRNARGMCKGNGIEEKKKKRRERREGIKESSVKGKTNGEELYV